MTKEDVSPNTIETLVQKGREKNWFSYPEEGLVAHYQAILGGFRELVKVVTGDTHGTLEMPGRDYLFLVPDEKEFEFHKPGGIDMVTVKIPLGEKTALTFNDQVTQKQTTLLLGLEERPVQYEGTELRIYPLRDGWITDTRNREEKQNHLHERRRIAREGTWEDQIKDLKKSIINGLVEIATGSKDYATMVQQERDLAYMFPEPERDWKNVTNKPDGIILDRIDGNFLVCKIGTDSLIIQNFGH